MKSKQNERIREKDKMWNSLLWINAVQFFLFMTMDWKELMYNNKNKDT